MGAPSGVHRGLKQAARGQDPGQERVRSAAGDGSPASTPSAVHTNGKERGPVRPAIVVVARTR
jgi:hypothetical protein